ncbi:hypothetical protein ACN1C3_30195 [Pseudomonas sp. H11T01]|uniref:hypothetical protein n=1 Tax=Pseudomonas sp. H11T01 TaxID=3402749 RepID=UPI003AD306F9
MNDSEKVHAFDALVIGALLAERSLALEVAYLRRLQRKLQALLEEKKELTAGQRARLAQLLDTIDARNKLLYVGD